MIPNDEQDSAFGGCSFLVLIATALLILIIFFFLIPAKAVWENVAGEWEQYRLNDSQMRWFESVRSKQNVSCCNIADGHPTEMKHLEDGYWIPNPIDPSNAWIRVPDEAMAVPPNNPIGVAVVWYVVQNGVDLHIRCFVPENEV